MVLCLVDSTAARIVLHRSARSRGYKLLREGTDPRSLWRCVCCLSEVHVVRVFMVCVVFVRCVL
jgi:hypothetical protein